MDDLEFLSLKARNLKCFADTEQGFEAIRKINVVIGRNNSGKSTLLDIVDYAIAGQVATRVGRGDLSAEILLSSPLTEPEVRRKFASNASGGPIRGNHYEFGKGLVGSRVCWVAASNSNDQRFQWIKEHPAGPDRLPDMGQADAQPLGIMLAQSKINPLHGRRFRRISAERDISPEPDMGVTSPVRSNGVGVTNLIQCFINKVSMPGELVEQTLLTELNKIFAGDAAFTDIVCRHLDDNSWEIFLEEQEKGRIALSKSGSGLKTVLMVLAHLILIPSLESSELSDYVFAFEELENNLHPALLRKLLAYLRKCAEDNGCIFFLTTHSSVEIDLFSRDKHAQIVHVTHSAGKSSVRTVKTYVENRGVLDDLDVRASDLLQANGIVWVEGPSDRVYVNRWIDLWSGGRLREGTHYQCVFYGGRLLNHLTSEDPEAIEDGISVLRVNRNACVLIDSDRRSAEAPINATKARIVREFEGHTNAMAWVTAGREVENYVPAACISQCYELPVTGEVGTYEDFFDYLNRLVPAEGDRHSKRKQVLAEKLVPHLTRENLQNVLDWASQIERLCQTVDAWNGVSSVA